MLNKLILYCTVSLLSFSGLTYAQDRETYGHFNERPFFMAINRPEGSLAYQFLNLIYSEVFRRLDIELEMEYRPLKRGYVEVIYGKFDGETTRIREYEDKHPTLIRVKEALYSTNVSAFALKPHIEEISGWQSLAGTDYLVEYPRGVVISEINLSKVVDPDNLSTVTTAEQGLKKLLLGRTDIYVGDDLVVYPLLKKLSTTYGRGVRKLGVLESVPLFMYVHEKNKYMEPIFREAIKEVKADGLIDQYRKIVFGF